jgi:O-antigen/teichoic acid export membrane protein
MKSKTFGWMDTLVLGLFVSSGLIGIYEISWRLASILILVSNAVETALFPEISEISSSGEYGEVRELLSEAIFYAGIFIIPGFFGTLVLGSDILRIYGTEFVAGAPILLILIVARTINVYEMQMLNVINGVDRPDVAFRINLVFIGVNVTLNFLLIWQFGWYGAAVATTVSSVVMLVLSYRAIDELMGVPSLPLAGIGKQILAAGGMAATVFVTQRALPFENMYATVGLVFFGAACYGIYLYVLSKRIRTKLRSLTAELSLS